MTIITRKDWEYTLFEHAGEYILSVICGSVAIFEIKLKLDDEEKQKYFSNGLTYIEEFVKKIQSDPNIYSTRDIYDLYNNRLQNDESRSFQEDLKFL